MTIIDIMNNMNNETKTAFETAKSVAMNASKDAYAKAQAVRNMDKKAEGYNDAKNASAIASAIKADCIAKVQEIIDAVYIESMLKDTTCSVDVFRKYFADIRRPVFSIGADRNQTTEMDSRTEAGVFTFKRVIKAVADKFDSFKSVDLYALFNTARSAVAGYVISQIVSEKNQLDGYKASWAESFGTSEMFEKTGRNYTEKTMQAVVDSLLGNTDDNKVFVRITRDWLLELCLVDHVFERDSKTMKGYVVDNGSFVNRCAIKIHKSYTNTNDTIACKRK